MWTPPCVPDFAYGDLDYHSFVPDLVDCDYTNFKLRLNQYGDVGFSDFSVVHLHQCCHHLLKHLIFD